jgi:hypothetical protein
VAREITERDRDVTLSTFVKRVSSMGREGSSGPDPADSTGTLKRGHAADLSRPESRGTLAPAKPRVAAWPTLFMSLRGGRRLSVGSARSRATLRRLGRIDLTWIGYS